MSDDAKQASPEDLYHSAMGHYNKISAAACDWHSSIPHALEFYFIEKPKLDAELAAANAKIAELEREAKWIRRRVDLPEDTPFVSGPGETLAGTMHCLVSNAHGYKTYIEAYKCDDKQGEIARLTVKLTQSQAEATAVRQRVIEAAEQAKNALAESYMSSPRDWEGNIYYGRVEGAAKVISAIKALASTESTENRAAPEQATELLPCPFCGLALTARTKRHNPHAECRTEGCFGSRMTVINLDDPADVAAWNRRAAPEQATPRIVIVPCCNYQSKDDDYPVYWNPFNGAMQCHNCGETWIPRAAPEQAESATVTHPCRDGMQCNDTQACEQAGRCLRCDAAPEQAESADTVRVPRDLLDRIEGTLRGTAQYGSPSWRDGVPLHRSTLIGFADDLRALLDDISQAEREE